MHLTGSHIHFIGIGGVGMCGLAELLHRLGAKVTGSDLVINSSVQELKKLGIKVSQGHTCENLGKPDVFVYSSAVPPNNPELLFAKENKIPIIPRAEVLAEIMQLRRGIAVGGTHGKTTTTSLISSVLLHGKLQPTIFVGGRLESIKSNALLGTGEWLVAEADESDGSFLNLRPEVVIITNIDFDHMDYYSTKENLLKNFREFALKVPFYGTVIACGDNPLVREALQNFPKKIIFYGFSSDNDFVLSGQVGKYEVQYEGKLLGKLDLNLPGRHNALNSLAALIAGLNCGLDFRECSAALSQFSGVGRRLEFIGNLSTTKFYDDYAHHPTEVKATLQAFREKYPEQKIAIIFQPHRYSRTKECWQDFLHSFSDADFIGLVDIYAANEKEISGVNSKKLADEIDHTDIEYLGSLDAAVEYLRNNYEKFDVVVGMGAGNITLLSKRAVYGD